MVAALAGTPPGGAPERATIEAVLGPIGVPAAPGTATARARRPRRRG
jgi:hypothetical protein